ncbi:hypothetical protein KFU94_71235 [Chloroflexi bacterium TSY]|nr:hypothetical protein [Chloroflexi bacterium TSY]
MMTDLYTQIVYDLEEAGKNSPYSADANEPDPRYKAYGVRAAGKKQIFQTYRSEICQLGQDQQIDLAERLIRSEFGEQQSMGLFILEPFAHYYLIFAQREGNSIR